MERSESLVLGGKCVANENQKGLTMTLLRVSPPCPSYAPPENSPRGEAAPCRTGACAPRAHIEQDLCMPHTSWVQSQGPDRGRFYVTLYASTVSRAPNFPPAGDVEALFHHLVQASHTRISCTWGKCVALIQSSGFVHCHQSLRRLHAKLWAFAYPPGGQRCSAASSSDCTLG